MIQRPEPVSLSTVQEVIAAGDQLDEQYRGDGLLEVIIATGDQDPFSQTRTGNFIDDIHRILGHDPASDEDSPYSIHIGPDSVTVWDITMPVDERWDIPPGDELNASLTGKQRAVLDAFRETPDASIGDVAARTDVSETYTIRVLDSVLNGDPAQQ